MNTPILAFRPDSLTGAPQTGPDGLTGAPTTGMPSPSRPALGLLSPFYRPASRPTPASTSTTSTTATATPTPASTSTSTTMLMPSSPVVSSGTVLVSPGLFPEGLSYHHQPSARPRTHSGSTVGSAAGVGLVSSPSSGHDYLRSPVLAKVSTRSRHYTHQPLSHHHPYHHNHHFPTTARPRRYSNPGSDPASSDGMPQLSPSIMPLISSSFDPLGPGLMDGASPVTPVTPQCGPADIATLPWASFGDGADDPKARFVGMANDLLSSPSLSWPGLMSRSPGTTFAVGMQTGAVATTTSTASTTTGANGPVYGSGADALFGRSLEQAHGLHHQPLADNDEWLNRVDTFGDTSTGLFDGALSTTDMLMDDDPTMPLIPDSMPTLMLAGPSSGPSVSSLHKRHWSAPTPIMPTCSTILAATQLVVENEDLDATPDFHFPDVLHDYSTPQTPAVQPLGALLPAHALAVSLDNPNSSVDDVTVGMSGMGTGEPVVPMLTNEMAGLVHSAVMVDELEDVALSLEAQAGPSCQPLPTTPAESGQSESAKAAVDALADMADMTDIEGFSCPVHLCGMLFLSEKDYSQHLDVNHGTTAKDLSVFLVYYGIDKASIKRRNADPNKGPSVCWICDSRFGRRYDLTRHLATVHATKQSPWSCYYCDPPTVLSRSDAQQRHMSTAHPELAAMLDKLAMKNKKRKGKRKSLSVG